MICHDPTASNIQEQFYRFSRGCKPRENLWNCSRKYTKMFKTDSFLGNKKLSLNQCQAWSCYYATGCFVEFFGDFSTSGFSNFRFFPYSLFQKPGSGENRKLGKTGSDEKPEVVKPGSSGRLEVVKTGNWKTGSGKIISTINHKIFWADFPWITEVSKVFGLPSSALSILLDKN